MYEDWEKFIDDLNPSKEIIEKAVSLPITINYKKESIKKIHKIIKDVFEI
jgi:dTDP-4-amino-4,6-dideoxygalactose transaminase